MTSSTFRAHPPRRDRRHALTPQLRTVVVGTLAVLTLGSLVGYALGQVLSRALLMFLDLVRSFLL